MGAPGACPNRSSVSGVLYRRPASRTCTACRGSDALPAMCGSGLREAAPPARREARGKGPLANQPQAGPIALLRCIKPSRSPDRQSLFYAPAAVQAAPGGGARAAPVPHVVPPAIARRIWGWHVWRCSASSMGLTARWPAAPGLSRLFQRPYTRSQPTCKHHGAMGALGGRGKAHTEAQEKEPPGGWLSGGLPAASAVLSRPGPAREERGGGRCCRFAVLGGRVGPCLALPPPLERPNRAFAPSPAPARAGVPRKSTPQSSLPGA